MFIFNVAPFITAWLIQSCTNSRTLVSQKEAHGAILGDSALSPPPKEAQVVGTISVASSSQYKSTAQWKRDRQKHRIREDSKAYEWKGDGEMHAWHVASVRRLQEPVPAGLKSQVGYGKPRSLNVAFAEPSS